MSADSPRSGRTETSETDRPRPTAPRAEIDEPRKLHDPRSAAEHSADVHSRPPIPGYNPFATDGNYIVRDGSDSRGTSPTGPGRSPDRTGTSDAAPVRPQDTRPAQDARPAQDTRPAGETRTPELSERAGGLHPSAGPDSIGRGFHEPRSMAEHSADVHARPPIPGYNPFAADGNYIIQDGGRDSGDGPGGSRDSGAGAGSRQRPARETAQPDASSPSRERQAAQAREAQAREAEPRNAESQARETEPRETGTPASEAERGTEAERRSGETARPGETSRPGETAETQRPGDAQPADANRPQRPPDLVPEYDRAQGLERPGVLGDSAASEAGLPDPSRPPADHQPRANEADSARIRDRDQSPPDGENDRVLRLGDAAAPRPPDRPGETLFEPVLPPSAENRDASADSVRSQHDGPQPPRTSDQDSETTQSGETSAESAQHGDSSAEGTESEEGEGEGPELTPDEQHWSAIEQRMKDSVDQAKSEMKAEHESELEELKAAYDAQLDEYKSRLEDAQDELKTVQPEREDSSAASPEGRDEPDSSSESETIREEEHSEGPNAARDPEELEKELSETKANQSKLIDLLSSQNAKIEKLEAENAQLKGDGGDHTDPPNDGPNNGPSPADASPDALAGEGMGDRQTERRTPWYKRLPSEDLSKFLGTAVTALGTVEAAIFTGTGRVEGVVVVLIGLGFSALTFGRATRKKKDGQDG